MVQHVQGPTGNRFEITEKKLVVVEGQTMFECSKP